MIRLPLFCAVIALLPASAFAGIEDWQVPPSPWIENEQALARSQLAALDTDIVVLPLQGSENRFAPIDRSLSAALIAAALGDRSDLVPANTYLIKMALGKQLSEYATSEVLDVAATARASTILYGHAEHNRAGRFSLTFSLLDAESGAIIRSKTWSGLAYSDSDPPAQRISERMSEILEFIVNGSVEGQRKATVVLGGRFWFLNDVG